MSKTHSSAVSPGPRPKSVRRSITFSGMQMNALKEIAARWTVQDRTKDPTAKEWEVQGVVANLLDKALFGASERGS